MGNMEQIEQELLNYIAESRNLTNTDKFIYLKAIFDKHFALEKMEHQLTILDFREIITNAKKQYSDTPLPMQISKREVYPSEVPQVLMIEALVGYLNKNKLLKRLIRIDYTK